MFDKIPDWRAQTDMGAKAALFLARNSGAVKLTVSAPPALHRQPPARARPLQDAARGKRAPYQPETLSSVFALIVRFLSGDRLHQINKLAADRRIGNFRERLVELQAF